MTAVMGIALKIIIIYWQMNTPFIGSTYFLGRETSEDTSSICKFKTFLHTNNTIIRSLEYLSELKLIK